MLTRRPTRGRSVYRAATEVCIQSFTRLYTIVYTGAVIEVLKTQAFSEWFVGLRDREAQRRIQARIDYLAVGGLGNAKRLNSALSELKIDHGPGYRLYFHSVGQC